MQSQGFFEFFCPVKTNSGNKALEHLPQELASLDAVKPLVVTSKDISGNGILKSFKKAFRDSGITIGVFDGTPGSPDIDTVKRLTKYYIENGFDSVIALGSGAVHDTAKALNIVVSGKPEDLGEYSGINKIPSPLKPFISVPVMEFSGSEISKFADIEDLSFSSHFIMPDLVVIDPRAVTPDKPEVIISTALTALTQAIEACIAPDKTPLADSYAFAAIKFISNNIIETVKKPKNNTRRLTIANAASMAGCAYSNTTEGCTSILSKACAPKTEYTTGILMGTILPYAIEYHIAKKPSDIERLLVGFDDFELFSKTPKNDRPSMVVVKIREMISSLNKLTGGKIPTTLKEAGISESGLNEILESVSDKSSDTLPAEDFRAIFKMAWSGDKR